METILTTLITNEERTMLDALANALQTSDSVDICVGYFYFSGFQLLAEQLKDKKIRILVGMEIDPECIQEIVKNSRENDVSLERYAPRRPTNSALQLQQNYMDALVGFVNDSDTFDTEESESTFDMFLSKIKDGSLEIRKTKKDFHGKFYLVHNKQEIRQGGDFPGTLFTGSSNFTFRGLSGQGELNDSSREKSKFEEHKALFANLWDSSNSISIAEKENSDEFIKEAKSKLWIYQQPTPYQMYVRVLHEIYKKPENLEKVKTPSKITSEAFLDFEYQTDAIKIAMDRIDKFDGVIIADVVGLGKSIIGSAVAHNLDMTTIIIAPPHLIPQWEDYKELFRIRGSKVWSSGNIAAIYERYSDSSIPLLFIIDEAHRFRNEDTADYKLLHQICRSNPNNKVILLTATPFNNSPQDVFALMKLFQTPGQSTIRSIDNLSIRFRELIQKYKKLRVDLRKSPNADFTKESTEISLEQRRFLEPIVIRRSRLDLEYITRYRKDLERQNISFPKVEGPTLLEYDLKGLGQLYLDTLSQIGDAESTDGFIGARYKPATYIIERDKFLEKYGSAVDDVDLKVAQTNLSDFMRKLLVMRFESSKFAFRTTLERMIGNNKLIINWWEKLEVVPIMKKGQLPDPDDYSIEDGEFADDLEAKLEQLRNTKGLLEIPAEWVDPQFILDVRHDTEVLQTIHDSWFSDPLLEELDPKTDELEAQIQRLLKENPERKIVIFSAYADTVNYVSKLLIDRGMPGILSFTAADSSKENRKTLLSNFDAAYAIGPQEDDYQVLICTDALSEGVNLHRAGVVINYDIPYNPTRVIQRIGRINRINKKVFNTIHIYNFFPTVLGDSEIRIKAISTLKINLIHNIVGSDTRTLTPEETLQSFHKDEFDLQTFFNDEFDNADKSEDDLSWDSVFIEDYETAIRDKGLMEDIEKIPRRSRISRTSSTEQRGVVFSKRGQNSVFVTSTLDSDPEVISTEDALRFFKAKEDEVGAEITSAFAKLFGYAKEKLVEKHALAEIRGRRAVALQLIEAVRLSLPSAESYCVDLGKIIKEYDDVSEGTLKDLSQIREKTPEAIYEAIRKLIPESFIRNILNRVDRMETESEVILLAEEFVK
jgi:superfamily II DNA or RNA helicase/HKD family nuclease